MNKLTEDSCQYNWIRLFIPKIDNDLTFGFCFQGQFVSAYDSFLSRQPCTYQVETMTPTTLWRISHEDLQFVYANTNVGIAVTDNSLLFFVPATLLLITMFTLIPLWTDARR